MNENQKRLLRKATPVARKIAVQYFEEGRNFDEVKEFADKIVKIEKSLYDSMKQSLVAHIRRHGLDALALGFFDDFVAIESFRQNDYENILKKVRKEYVRVDGQIVKLKADPNAGAKLEQLEISLINLEYLISKITEYLQKVKELTITAFDLVISGKTPDLEAWKDKVLIQDNLFEENKQFLKQALHHLSVLEKNKCKLGPEHLRMLLYHREGCRREKLYRQVERWIIKIYCSLQTREEASLVYKDICSFVQEVVPKTGYISPVIIQFILDKEYVSKDTRDLLLEIQPIIRELGMISLITTPLARMYKQASQNLLNGKESLSDVYVAQIMQLYEPKHISQQVADKLSAIKD